MYMTQGDRQWIRTERSLTFVQCVTPAATRGWIAAALCLALAACSGGGKGGGGTGPTGTAPIGEKVNALALVLSSSGAPVENAMISGGDAVSTAEGVIAGTVTPGPSGWNRVTADGYADGFTRRSGKALRGWNIYEARLAPIASAVIYAKGVGAALLAGDGRHPAVKIVLGPAMFPQGEIIAELAVMKPVDVGPEFAPLSSGAALYLHKAFYVSAHDPGGREVPFQAGTTAEATILDDRMEDNTLAGFDVRSGKWEVMPNACTRPDKRHIRCGLPHAGTYGLFGASAPAGAAGDAFSDARQAFRKAVGEWRRRGAAAASKPPPAALAAGQDLVKEVRHVAAAQPGEAGQMHLLAVAADARMIGMRIVSVDLLNDARRYVQSMAQTLMAQAPDCGRIRFLLDTAAKADLLGLDQLRHDLIFKARNSYGDCDVWAGTVHYTFFMEDQWPRHPGYRWRGGPQIWTEAHRLKLVVSPKIRNTQGEDRVATVMPPVTYERRFKNACSGDNLEQREVSGVPATADLRLVFDGRYNYVHETFALGAPDKASSQTIPVRIDLADRARLWKRSAGGCRATESKGTSTLVGDYRSMLVDGFAGKADPPFLQDMLNNGQRHKLGNGKVVSGGRLITLTAAAGALPFRHALVSWHLINVPPAP